MTSKAANVESFNEGKGSEAQRALAGFLLGIALGALVGLLAKRKPAP